MGNTSTLPKLDLLDKRLNAYRDNIANEVLKGKVEAKNFIKGTPGKVVAPVCDLKFKPDFNASTEHQLLGGTGVEIFESKDQWSWVQSKRDGYVGFVPQSAISTNNNAMIHTHSVCVANTFCYPRAELRAPPVYALTMGCQVIVTGAETVRGTGYALLVDGCALIAKHLRKVDDHDKDFVAVCEQLLHTPYLWGGASGFGIDCSGLVQLAMHMCGRKVLRDTDMQAATIGEEIDAGKNFENLQRGDLIFWRGHVAIHKGSVHNIPHIIHASGHTMSVAIEPLYEALERIEYLYEKPIGFRRP